MTKFVEIGASCTKKNLRNVYDMEEEHVYYSLDIEKVREHCKREGIVYDASLVQRRIIECENHLRNTVCFEVQEVKFEDSVPNWQTMYYTDPCTLNVVPARFQTLVDAFRFKKDPNVFDIVYRTII